jgi:hypothetical protein
VPESLATSSGSLAVSSSLKYPTKRNHFPKLELEIKTGGTTVLKYPFLEQNSRKDLVVLRHLAASAPYKAGYGKSQETWETVLNNIQQERDEEGDLVFPSGFKLRLLKERFKEYMSFIKRYNAKVPFRSGNDDEESFELLQLCEEVFEDFTSYELEKENKKDDNNAKLKGDLLAAENLRKASLGQMKYKEVKEVKEVIEIDSSTESNTKYSSKYATMMTGYNALVQQSSIREERLKLREENRCKQLKLREEEAKIRATELKLLMSLIKKEGKKRTYDSSSSESSE